MLSKITIISRDLSDTYWPLSLTVASNNVAGLLHRAHHVTLSLFFPRGVFLAHVARSLAEDTYIIYIIIMRATMDSRHILALSPARPSIRSAHPNLGRQISLTPTRYDPSSLSPSFSLPFSPSFSRLNLVLLSLSSLSLSLSLFFSSSRLRPSFARPSFAFPFK